MADDFRRKILQQLKERNARVNDGYAPLVKSYNELLDFVVALKLRKAWPPDRRNSEGGPPAEADNKVIAQLQAEVTELYRRRSENSQQLIDANNRLQARDNELATSSKKLKQAEDSVSALLEAKKNLEQRIEELTAANQQLRDEFFALQSTYGALEEKYRRLEGENNQVLRQLMAYKDREVEVMNIEADLQMKMQQLQLKNQLAEAAREQIAIVGMPEPFEPVDPVPHICVGATVPNRCKHKLEAHDNEVFCVCWSPAGRYLATGGGDRKLKLWKIEEDRVSNATTLGGCNKSVSCMDFDAEEMHVMAGSFDCAIRIWSLNDQRVRHSLNGHSDKVMTTKFMGSSAKVVSGSYDRTVKIWDLRTRACIHTFFPGSSCNDVVVAEGMGVSVISGHFDKKLRFYDARSSEPQREVLLNGKVTSLDLSADKMNLLVCTREDVLHYYDLRANKIVHNYSAEGFKIGFDYSRAVLSPDAQFCAAGSADGQLYIWNVLTGRLEKALGKPSTVGIIACAWHPHGQLVATSEKHRTVAIWSDV